MSNALPSPRRLARLIALCAACLGAQARADETACPTRHVDKPLEIGYVLDGLAQDGDAIMPDASGQQSGVEFATWLVERLYDRGRRVTLECHYGGLPDPLFVPVTKPVTLCSFGKTKERMVTLACE